MEFEDLRDQRPKMTTVDAVYGRILAVTPCSAAVAGIDTFTIRGEEFSNLLRKDSWLILWGMYTQVSSDCTEICGKRSKTEDGWQKTQWE